MMPDLLHTSASHSSSINIIANMTRLVNLVKEANQLHHPAYLLTKKTDNDEWLFPFMKEI
jgi:hypothetical protein